MIVQMNTRIDEDAKKAGDAAFAAIGYTPSQVVRTVWAFAARCGNDRTALESMLDSMREPDAEGSEARRQRTRALKQAAGLVGALAEEHGLVLSDEYRSLPYDELRELALTERLAKTGLL